MSLLLCREVSFGCLCHLFPSSLSPLFSQEKEEKTLDVVCRLSVFLRLPSITLSNSKTSSHHFSNSFPFNFCYWAKAGEWNWSEISIYIWEEDMPIEWDQFLTGYHVLRVQWKTILCASTGQNIKHDCRSTMPLNQTFCKWSKPFTR